MELYERLVKNLGRLEANERNMTERQRVQYKKALAKLRKSIGRDATAYMCMFLNRGNAIPLTDADGRREYAKKAEEILAAEEIRIKGAFKTLFSTYSVEKFLETLLPLQCWIRYEAYGPVWLRHCRECAREIENDIIGAYWDADNGLWLSKSGHWATFSLPPTAGALEAEYREEMARFEVGAEK